MMVPEQSRVRAMNNDDEIWGDEDEPSGSDEPHDAMLVDVQDPSVSFGARVIEASSEDEAISKARQWALAECQKIGKKARLTVVGGAISGSHSEEIDPAQGQ
jgi:hypothetical protein